MAKTGGCVDRCESKPQAGAFRLISAQGIRLCWGEAVGGEVENC